MRPSSALAHSLIRVPTALPFTARSKTSTNRTSNDSCLDLKIWSEIKWSSSSVGQSTPIEASESSTAGALNTNRKIFFSHLFNAFRGLKRLKEGAQAVCG